MIDGIINNGTKEEKASVLDELQEKKELLLTFNPKSQPDQMCVERE